MAYVDNVSVFNSNWEGGASTAEDLSATAADHLVFWFPIPVVVTGFGFVTTEAVGDATTEAVIALDHRVTAGSDTGRVEKATITFSGGTLGSAVGDVVLCADSAGTSAFEEFTVDPGQQLVFEHKTQASGGTTTGAGHYFITYRAGYEVPGNVTTWDVASS